MAVLKCQKFAASSERFNAEQKKLLEEDTDADLQALSEKTERVASPEKKGAGEKQAPKHWALPAELAPATRPAWQDVSVPVQAVGRAPPPAGSGVASLFASALCVMTRGRGRMR